MKDKDEQYWKEKLSEEEYNILREKGTEAPFTGDLLEMKKDGVYTCKACGHELFKSDAKYDSKTGWPSFFEVADQGNIDLVEDNSHGMHRTEVTCANCGGHLGHLFENEPTPTGKRFCINSASLKFDDKK